MCTELTFSINDERFTAAEHTDGWAWTHWSKSRLVGVIAESDDFFATSVEAQQDAMRYLSEWEAEEDERQAAALEDARFGTYRDQVDAIYRAVIR